MDTLEYVVGLILPIVLAIVVLGKAGKDHKVINALRAVETEAAPATAVTVPSTTSLEKPVWTPNLPMVQPFVTLMAIYFVGYVVAVIMYQ
ncbi:hypothetical protein KIPB_014535, partial [Kipferlia bialata]|eukprot:g14535.t1